MSIRHYLLITLAVLLASCNKVDKPSNYSEASVIYNTSVELVTDTSKLLAMSHCDDDYHYGLNELYFQDNDKLIFGVRFVFFINEPTLVDYKPFVNNAIQRLNIDFDPAKISFKALEIKLIEDSEAYASMQYYQQHSFKYYQKGALNIFVYPNTMEPPIAGAAIGIPSTSMAIKSFFLDKSTISHEVGHMLGLYHTHQKDTASINTNDSGDYVCDTPNANQFSENNRGFLGQVDDECQYTGKNELSTEDNELIVNNLMSYSNLECRCCLTDIQIKRMKWTIENSQDLRYCLQLSL